jgi:predicted DNA-binding transcriptional regulator AlpA
MAERRLFKIKEYADYTAQSPGSIYNKILRNEPVPGLVRLGSGKQRTMIRFDRKAVDQWLDSLSEKGGE